MMRQGAVGLAVAGTVIAIAAGIIAHHRMHGTQQPLAHARTAFSFTLNASKHAAFPLFGSSGERRWGTGPQEHAWEPHFLWPTPEQDAEGEVITIHHGHHGMTAVWINTAFDEAAGHAQYATFLPDYMVSRIDVRLTELSPGKTQVDVIYDQTALDARANASILRRPSQAAQLAKEWQQEVSAALR